MDKISFAEELRSTIAKIITYVGETKRPKNTIRCAKNAGEAISKFAACVAVEETAVQLQQALKDPQMTFADVAK